MLEVEPDDPAVRTAYALLRLSRLSSSWREAAN